MAETLLAGVSSGTFAQKHGAAASGIDGMARLAVDRPAAWKRFLNDVAKGMVMMDPIAYGWYVVSTLEAR